MKLTVPNHPQNSTRQAKIFYVSSESSPNSTEASHIVVQHGLLYFCDCRDFMVRRLPLLGLVDFRLCKHGKFVQDTHMAAEPGVTIIREQTAKPAPKKFAVYYEGDNGDFYLSADVLGTFDTFVAASKALDAFYRNHKPSGIHREVRAL